MPGTGLKLMFQSRDQENQAKFTRTTMPLTGLPWGSGQSWSGWITGQTCYHYRLLASVSLPSMLLNILPPQLLVAHRAHDWVFNLSSWPLSRLWRGGVSGPPQERVANRGKQPPCFSFISELPPGGGRESKAGFEGPCASHPKLALSARPPGLLVT